MTNRARYSLEADLEEAEAAAKKLPDQIARLREEVRKAKKVLSGENPVSGELSEQ